MRKSVGDESKTADTHRAKTDPIRLDISKQLVSVHIYMWRCGDVRLETIHVPCAPQTPPELHVLAVSVDDSRHTHHALGFASLTHITPVTVLEGSG
jgi:hypothetical protein